MTPQNDLLAIIETLQETIKTLEKEITALKDQLEPMNTEDYLYWLDCDKNE